MPRFPDAVGMCELFAADSLTKVTKRPSLDPPGQLVPGAPALTVMSNNLVTYRRAAALVWTVEEISRQVKRVNM